MKQVFAEIREKRERERETDEFDTKQKQMRRSALS